MDNKHVKMSNIIRHQGNAKKNHYKVSLQTDSNG